MNSPNLIIQYSDLKDKKVLITGATRGIGRGIALNLAQQKSHIVFNYREHSKNEAESLVKEILDLGGRATALKFDLTDINSFSETLGEFISKEGPISGVIHNAGVTQNQLILKTKEESIDSVFDINVKGTILLTSFLSRSLIKANDVSIIFISSVVGLSGNSAQSVYSASKAALVGFGKSIAKELSIRNIRSNIVCPGLIDTDMSQKLDQKLINEYIEQVPLKRMGTPNDVANLCSFLLSGASSYITGEVIKVDGGLYI